eukprot:CAMPEP_0185739574 /NCGR_PEP_ID=MMETSP1171-20130828/35720_1 /TAXON_ID=374046 /ORGANISM="Helicotheca tamensis, Strain CCMP826" /LENGTH=316 /DNA_ID=CAMNT_0028411181 /DNA_START=748 /DNA_END=1698 /DNA_ORIENTATION=+
MRPLVERLDAKVGISHDGVGFGFTNRPPTRLRMKSDLAPYSSAGWAALGNALLLNRIQKDEEIASSSKNGNLNLNGQKRVVLVGHSMGAAATLKMALTLPKEVVKVVVLVAPALIAQSSGRGKSCDIMKYENKGSQKTSVITSCIRNLLSRYWSRIGAYVTHFRSTILDLSIFYFLRRVVSTPGFWSAGSYHTIGFYWDLSILGFQWPAISHDWERGILGFVKSRLVSACPYAGGELELLNDVLMLPKTSLIIIHGTNDDIVPISMTRKILQEVSDGIQFFEMEGKRHMPQVEKPEEFMALVESHIHKAMNEAEKS